MNIDIKNKYLSAQVDLATAISNETAAANDAQAKRTALSTLQAEYSTLAARMKDNEKMLNNPTQFLVVEGGILLTPAEVLQLKSDIAAKEIEINNASANLRISTAYHEQMMKITKQARRWFVGCREQAAADLFDSALNALPQATLDAIKPLYELKIVFSGVV